MNLREMRSLYYRRDGTPYPEGQKGLREWAKDFENIKYKRVAQDFLLNGVEVSTIWLGLDHSFGASRPLIFETMMFVPCHKRIEFLGRMIEIDREQIGEQFRYATEEEALRGHRLQVSIWAKFKTIDQVLAEGTEP